MRLSITHETTYSYKTPVESSHHLAHLTPPSNATQTVLEHRLDIAPAPSDLDRSERMDFWGNRVTQWYQSQNHHHLRVWAQTLIDTRALDAVDSVVNCGQASEDLKNSLQFGNASPLQWTYPSHHVPRHPEFNLMAYADLAPERPLVEAAIALMQRLHQTMTYDSSSTEVDTPALSAWQARRGVCQDFAHILLAGLRQRGQAACYVSGYLLTQAPEGRSRLIGADASHAWVAIRVPGLESHPSSGWLHLDPTNARHGWGSPGSDYVILAQGRDYADVSPLRGVLRGGDLTAPQVRVSVLPVLSLIHI